MSNIKHKNNYTNQVKMLHLTLLCISLRNVTIINVNFAISSTQGFLSINLQNREVCSFLHEKARFPEFSSCLDQRDCVQMCYHKEFL